MNLTASVHRFFPYLKIHFVWQFPHSVVAKSWLHHHFRAFTTWKYMCNLVHYFCLMYRYYLQKKPCKRTRVQGLKNYEKKLPYVPYIFPNRMVQISSWFFWSSVKCTFVCPLILSHNAFTPSVKEKSGVLHV